MCVEIHFEEQDFRGIVDANLHRDTRLTASLEVDGPFSFSLFFFPLPLYQGWVKCASYFRCTGIILLSLVPAVTK